MRERRSRESASESVGGDARSLGGGGFRQCGFGDLAHPLCALGGGTGVQGIREALRFVPNFDNRRYSLLPWPDLVMRDCPAYLARLSRLHGPCDAARTFRI